MTSCNVLLWCIYALVALEWDGMGCARNSMRERRLHLNTSSYQRSPSHPIPAQRACECIIRLPFVLRTIGKFYSTAKPPSATFSCGIGRFHQRNCTVRLAELDWRLKFSECDWTSPRWRTHRPLRRHHSRRKIIKGARDGSLSRP